MQDCKPLSTARTPALGTGGRGWKERLAQHRIRRKSLPRAATASPFSLPALELLESKPIHPQQTSGINHSIFMLHKAQALPSPQSCADHPGEDAQGEFGHCPAFGRPGKAQGHRIPQSQALRTGQELLLCPHTAGSTGDAGAEQAEQRDHHGKALCCWERALSSIRQKKPKTLQSWYGSREETSTAAPNSESCLAQQEKQIPAPIQQQQRPAPQE